MYWVQSNGCTLSTFDLSSWTILINAVGTFGMGMGNILKCFCNNIFWFSSDGLSGLGLNIHSDITKAVVEDFFVTLAECTDWPMCVCICV